MRDGDSFIAMEKHLLSEELKAIVVYMQGLPLKKNIDGSLDKKAIRILPLIVIMANNFAIHCCIKWGDVR
jgi:hypothetical protein